MTIEVSAGSADHDAEKGIVRWTLESPAAEATLVLQPA